MRAVVIITMCVLLILAAVPSGRGQQMRCTPDKPVVCYYRNVNAFDRIPNPFLNLRQSSAARVKRATFEVEYVNFPEDDKARKAFEYAIDIWEQTLTSSVPIRVRAEWEPLAEGVLGQALWGSAYSNFGGEQHRDVFYPVALAEKIARRELNPSTEPDIVASFNSEVSWYLETDGQTPAGQMDLVTIVLHEVAHGLGFTDSFDIDGDEGTIGIPADGRLLPFVFDVFVTNAASEPLLPKYGSPSRPLAAALRSTDLFFGGRLSVAELDGVEPELYAPRNFGDGSSISHLDEAAFSDAGNANKLMTPHIDFAESIHDPGGLLVAMLGDIGWRYTYLDHQPLRDTETVDGQPHRIAVRVDSDEGYESEAVQLHYSTDGVSFTTVTMTPSGISGEYEYALPGRTTPGSYAYYISVVDNAGRRFTHPGMIHAAGKAAEPGLHNFAIGPDTEPPMIAHTAATHMPATERRFTVTAEVTDNLGVQEAVVEYATADGILRKQVMSRDGDQFSTTINLPVLETGERIEYRIAASDIAATTNTSQDPAAGYHVVALTGIMPSQDSYSNDFNTATFDLFGDHFRIATPPGFRNGAIHTDHPYMDASGPDPAAHYTYQLQIPIRINPDNPVIVFDEIVLVEPGDTGSEFGSSGFFDYVIVEGSGDKGATWKPFGPGYDARHNDVWLSRYNGSVSSFNSQAIGDPALFRQKKINMLANGNFQAGDEVLIRFRLFADELAHGWGWAIDNLFIQAPVTRADPPAPVTLQIYPVPVSEDLYVVLNTQRLPAVLEITDVRGRTLFRKTIYSDLAVVEERIDVRNLPEGILFLKARLRGEVYYRKFIKAPH